MTKFELAKFVWRFLAPLPAFWRTHQVGRSLLSPFIPLMSFVEMQSQVSEDFVLLDLGCGHGIFLAMVAFYFSRIGRPAPKLVGIDLSADKIKLAQSAFSAAGLTASQLAVKDIAEFEPRSANMISILDVMYLVPLAQWDGVLGKCYDALKPGGTLLLKEMNRERKWKFRLLLLEETLAVKVLGLTLGGKFTFPPPEEIRRRLQLAGFEVEEKPLDRGYHVPHMIWVGHKPA
jgi:2-polyprenyl-3-methyl-5-hydroxy-6-metoxy-1,4-benzoquinol methylase